MTARDSLERGVLPIPDRKPVGLTTYDAKDPDTRFPPIVPLRPPTGAPNVLVILLDDVGFGASSAFGGPCRTPTAERLAADGLKYNRFHTTALCSPTRAAMLSGRNHHAVGMGGITEIATSAPGYNSLRPNTCAPLAEILKLNGYSTAQFGKCHEVPVFETTPIGPFHHWPTGSGFEHFYGFIGGENNQYYPELYDGTTPIEPERTPEQGYHLMEDLADKAIGYIRQQKAIAPDQPFFVYFAPGATHAPHHVPKDWIARYKGQFDQGWDKLREETFARQKKLGVIPADLRADEAARGHSRVERDGAAAAPRARARDGDLRRVPRVRRPSRRPRGGCAGRAGDPGRHARLLHHRRQRRIGRGLADRRLERQGGAEAPDLATPS
jgi:arylsulfatase